MAQHGTTQHETAQHGTAQLGRAGIGPTTSTARTGPVVAALGLGGLLLAAGGLTHPRGSGATVRDTVADMLGSPAWTPSHLVGLAGLLVATGGLVAARRSRVLGGSVDPWLTLTIVAWALASIEVVPHVLAVRDLDALHHHGPTPVLDTHLALAVGATPAFGLAAAALAVAVARAARTVPARLLAVPAVAGGVAYAAAGPLIHLADGPRYSVLFAGQGLVAAWLVGTAVRLALRRQAGAAICAAR